MGIIIIALGYDIYGTNAYNLALSLKAYDQIKICLLYDEAGIRKLGFSELSLFDYLIEIPESEYIIGGKKQYQIVKLLTYKYSPFDFTVYMDADSIWIPDKKVSDLIDNIKEHDFIIGMNGGYDVKTGKKHSSTGKDYPYWGQPKLIADYFNIQNHLPQTVSGFFSFMKSDKAERIFNKALEVYKDEKAPTVQWANGKADEYCFNVAMGVLGYTQEPLHVFYFYKLNGNKDGEYIYKNFWGIAMGGHKIPDNLIILYNRLVNTLSIKMGKTVRYYHTNKANAIPERKIF